MESPCVSNITKIILNGILVITLSGIMPNGTCGEWINFQATQSNCFYCPSEKGSPLKGKNLLPMGANSFLIE